MHQTDVRLIEGMSIIVALEYFIFPDTRSFGRLCAWVSPLRFVWPPMPYRPRPCKFRVEESRRNTTPASDFLGGLIQCLFDNLMKPDFAEQLGRACYAACSEILSAPFRRRLYARRDDSGRLQMWHEDDPISTPE